MTTISEFCKDYKKLNREEELAHVLLARNGNDRSMKIIINSIMPLICSNAIKMANSKIGFNELVSEGVIGVYKALETFDDKKNTRFSSWAMGDHGWVMNAIKAAVANVDVVGISAYYQNKDGVELSTTSYDAPITEDGFTLADVLAADEADSIGDTTIDLTEARLAKLFNILPAQSRERAIMERRMIGHTHREIGEFIGVSHETVRQLEKKAIETIQYEVYA